MPAIRGANSKSKTRRRERDLDQVHEDLHSEKHLAKFKSTKDAEDLPDLGKWYCVECAKWFESKKTLVAHQRGKPHKRRQRALKDEPFTQQEAEIAAGYSHTVKTAEDMEVDAEESINPADCLVRHREDYDDNEEYDAFFSTYKG